MSCMAAVRKYYKERGWIRQGAQRYDRLEHESKHRGRFPICQLSQYRERILRCRRLREYQVDARYGAPKRWLYRLFREIRLKKRPVRPPQAGDRRAWQSWSIGSMCTRMVCIPLRKPQLHGVWTAPSPLAEPHLRRSFNRTCAGVKTAEKLLSLNLNRGLEACPKQTGFV